MPSQSRGYLSNLRGLAEGLEDRVGTVAQEATEVIHGALVLGTPVLTGKARSNWLVGTSGPPQGVFEPRSEVATIEDGQSVIRNSRKADRFEIVNNVGYIGLLNSGSSRKAPAGFVQKAITLGLNIVKQRRILRSGTRY